MLRINSFALSIISSALLVGCASTDRIVLDNTKRSPTASVDVFKDGTMPNRENSTIAELSYLGPREEELKALTRFINDSKQLGGNGIIFSVVSAGIKGGGTIFQTSAWVFKGKVIVYTDRESHNSNKFGKPDYAANIEATHDLVGHWESVDFDAGQNSNGVQEVQFDFLPNGAFVSTTLKNGSTVQQLKGKYSVAGEKLFLTSSDIGEDAMGFNQVGDHLVISAKPYQINLHRVKP